MKRSTLIIAIILFFSQVGFANDTSKIVLKTFKPELQHNTIFQFVGWVLSNNHYRKLTLNDSLSSQYLNNYIKHLDPSHIYFLKSDIQNFEKFRKTLDDDLKLGKPNAGFEMYNVYQTRLEERINYTFDLLNSQLYFSSNDSFSYKREDVDFAESMKEMDQLWRNKIKYEVLASKTGDKDYKSVAEIVRKRYYNLYKQLSKTRNEDVFSFYVNSLTEIADPHTDYFSPKVAEDFNQSMSLSLEGIGATLQTDNEYTKIVTLVKGGPADRSKKIFNNDKIVGVAQGKDGEMVNVLDWRIDEVVGLIRGKKGTLVRLQIIPHDATDNKTKVIEIVRDKIVLEDQAAKGSIKEIIRNNKTYKMGVINIPSFYMDFAAASRGDRNYKSTTRDVKKIIDSLSKQNIDGLVIDLRSNGGGSLQEAVELSGLFIKKGPVVQVKESSGMIRPYEDNNEEVLWNKPLAVIVNRFSASASEIFAAAMQDYGRAILIGEQTFGKGTVQNPIDINGFIQIGDLKFGEIKLTIAKFYRISGGSTQHHGVFPDIHFPGIYSGKEYSESGNEFSLPYDEINKMKFEKVADLSNRISLLKSKHDERMKINDEYNYLLEDIATMEAGRKKQFVSLNEEKFKSENKINEEKNKLRVEQRKKAKEKKGKNSENVDLILDETKEILVDLINGN